MFSLLYWIILGGIAGWIGSKVVNKTGSGLIMDVALGVVGSIVGGFLAGLVGFSAAGSGFIVNLIIAVIGAIIVLVVYRNVIAKA